MTLSRLHFLPIFWLFCLTLKLSTEDGLAAASSPTGSTQTFCNPLNLDYRLSGKSRHAADPVIVLFHGKYFLFTTWDLAGYRVSEDLIHWQDILIQSNALLEMTEGNRTYCAAAVAVKGDWMYFIPAAPSRAGKRVSVMRTQDPLSGQWEKCGEIPQSSDPALFFDDDGRAYVYHGLGAGNPTRVFELDTNTFTKIPGSDRVLRDRIQDMASLRGGYERGRNEIFAETDTEAFLDRFKILPCQEGALMTKYAGKYYLQYATPGTVCQWYCDAVMVGDSATGPFRDQNYSPASLKIGGFMGSAGHSCVFQDKHGNWWRVTTMWIGVLNRFERRIGLFPCGFDKEGRMFTQTTLGDYPQIMPDRPLAPDWAVTTAAGAPPNLAGWWLLSAGKKCTASSGLTNHLPESAADENSRTWWSAQTGNTNEWFQMDLGRATSISAVQLNFAEQDISAPNRTVSDDFHAYLLLASEDAKNWTVLADKSSNRTCLPHDYLTWPKTMTARFLKVINWHTPAGGKFAIRDLRVFGTGAGLPPKPVTDLKVERHADDERNVTFRWTPTASATGYLLRYGVAPDALHLTMQVNGASHSNLTVHVLNRGVKYSFRLDAFNDCGVTAGQIVQK